MHLLIPYDEASTNSQNYNYPLACVLFASLGKIFLHSTANIQYRLAENWTIGVNHQMVRISTKRNFFLDLSKRKD